MINPKILIELLEAAPEIIKLVGQAADALTKNWRDFQQTAFETGRAIGMSREAAMRYDRELMQNTKDLARAYGVSAKEIAKFQENYALATGRNITLTKQQTEQMAALSKVAGSATAEKLVQEFEGIGVSISDTLAYTGQIQERAKYLGLTGTKAAAALADNVKLAASYSFRNGVEDIERMVLKSQSLKMNMQSVMQAADKFSTIEGAISTSANIQMLGGTFAQQYSNPMAAMYEATADPAAFQDRIIKAIGGKGTYDAKTGQVKFDPVTMMQMKEFAKQMGMSAEEVGQSAMAIKQNQAVDKELAGKNWTAEQKTAIENLARTNVDEKTGKHYVSWTDKNGVAQKANVEDLTPEQLKVAQDSQMTQEKMWDDVHAIKSKIVGDTESRARGTVSFDENVQGFKEEGKAATAQFQNGYMPAVSGGLNGKDFSFWDKIKQLFDIPGQSHWGSGSAEGWNDTPQGPKFAQGGIVHANDGTIVPGNSFYGDNVPVQANSGEMILTQEQQSGLFDLIKTVAEKGLGVIAGNFIGSKLGMKGLGTHSLIMQALGGGDMLSNMMMEASLRTLLSGNSIKAQFAAAQAANNKPSAVESAVDTVSNLQDLKDTYDSLFKDSFKETKQNLKGFSKYIDKAKNGLGKLGGKAKSAGASFARFTRMDKGWAKAVSAKNHVVDWGKVKGAIISGKYGEFKDWFKTTKVGKFNQKVGRFNKGLASDMGRLSNRFKAFGRLQNIRRASALSKVMNVAEEIPGMSKIGKAAPSILKNAGKFGKIASFAGKGFGKAIPFLGSAMSVIGSVGDIMDASSNYDAKKQAIMNSNMSDAEKENALNEAVDTKRGEQGSAVGKGVGAIAGAALGASLGSVVPVVGTAIGGIVGGFVGEKLGGAVGKLAKPLSKMTRGIKNFFFGGKKENEANGLTNSTQLSDPKLSQKADLATVKIYEILAKKNDGGILAKAAKGGLTGLAMAATPLSLIAAPLFGGISKIATGGIKSLPVVGAATNIVNKDKRGNQPISANIGPKDINLKVSGTIKLDLGGKQANIDADKLVNNPVFKEQLTRIISKQLNTMGNSGKYNKEGSVRNTQAMYNGLR